MARRDRSPETPIGDAACVEFLRWALPRLRLRWQGFRRVRRQVCKRLHRRLRTLGIDDLDTYRTYLDSHSEEWHRVDEMCRITISRFYRDRGMFDALARRVLPELCDRARRDGRRTLRCWSAGCGAGEEPYTLSILWHLEDVGCADMTLNVRATDSDPHQLARAETACYAASSLKELPTPWRQLAFERRDRRYCLRQCYRRDVTFTCEDIREAAPDIDFDLILCRNVALTYFAEPLQSRVLDRLLARLKPGGVLSIGRHESLPPGTGLAAMGQGLYRVSTDRGALPRKVDIESN
jgi:chemotaxis protein methyltransferase CheR